MWTFVEAQSARPQAVGIVTVKSAQAFVFARKRNQNQIAGLNVEPIMLQSTATADPKMHSGTMSEAM